MEKIKEVLKKIWENKKLLAAISFLVGFVAGMIVIAIA